MTTTRHLLMIDLPHGPKDLGAEMEVDIGFDYTPAGEAGSPPVIRFIFAVPSQPFDYQAERQMDWLQDVARDWLESAEGREEALEQVMVDRTILGLE